MLIKRRNENKRQNVSMRMKNNQVALAGVAQFVGASRAPKGQRFNSQSDFGFDPDQGTYSRN